MSVTDPGVESPTASLSSPKGCGGKAPRLLLLCVLFPSLLLRQGSCVPANGRLRSSVRRDSGVASGQPPDGSRILLGLWDRTCPRIVASGNMGGSARTLVPLLWGFRSGTLLWVDMSFYLPPGRRWALSFSVVFSNLAGNVEDLVSGVRG